MKTLSMLLLAAYCTFCCAWVIWIAIQALSVSDALHIPSLNILMVT